MKWKSVYRPPQILDWQINSAANAENWLCELVKTVDCLVSDTDLELNNSAALVGFACDAGVIRNNGRPGAKQGPMAIRKQLGEYLAKNQFCHNIYDLGTIECYAEIDLEQSQQLLGEFLQYLRSNKIVPVVVGGGHETAWGHYQGFAAEVGSKKLTIINFDSHFDLRDTLPEEKGTSGTPFTQIIADRVRQDFEYEYVVIGIQPGSNMEQLFNKANSLNCKYLLADEVRNSNGEQAKKLLTETIANAEAIYLTICLDVFAKHIAPGVSAPQEQGLEQELVSSLLQFVLESQKVIAADIVEMAPTYDINFKTAKLASEIIIQIFKGLTKHG